MNECGVGGDRKEYWAFGKEMLMLVVGLVLEQ